jgi:hypothetical protein
MSSRPLSRYQFRLVQELLLAGINVWQIEALPDEVEIKRTGYKKSILFVRKDNFVLIRAAHILDKGGLIKYQDIKSLELIDGIWVATEIHMTTKRGKEVRHRTVLFNKDTQFNRPMQASWFTSNQLEKGLPK